MNGLPFDSIVIEDSAAGEQRLTLEEFLAIPLATRVKYIMEKKLRFFLGEALVERALGLRTLMMAARQASPK